MHRAYRILFNVSMHTFKLQKINLQTQLKIQTKITSENQGTKLGDARQSLCKRAESDGPDIVTCSA
jgi:hypothetical protein